MQTVSSTYTSILANGGWHECKLEINGTAYDMEKIVSMRTSAALWDGAVSIGNTIAGTIDVSLIAPSSSVPTMAELRPYVRATNGTQHSEWLPKGVYFIDTREYDKESGVLRSFRCNLPCRIYLYVRQQHKPRHSLRRHLGAD